MSAVDCFPVTLESNRPGALSRPWPEAVGRARRLLIEAGWVPVPPSERRARRLAFFHRLADAGALLP